MAKKNNIHSKIKELKKHNPGLSYHQILMKALGVKEDGGVMAKRSGNKTNK